MGQQTPSQDPSVGNATKLFKSAGCPQQLLQLWGTTEAAAGGLCTHQGSGDAVLIALLCSWFEPFSVCLLTFAYLPSSYGSERDE